MKIQRFIKLLSVCSLFLIQSAFAISVNLANNANNNIAVDVICAKAMNSAVGVINVAKSQSIPLRAADICERQFGATNIIIKASDGQKQVCTKLDLRDNTALNVMVNSNLESSCSQTNCAPEVIPCN